MLLRIIKSAAILSAALFVSTSQAETEQSFVACSKAPSKPEDRRTDAEQLRIATFNAEFLFTKGLGRLDCPGKDCNWKNLSQAKKHINGIAQVIYDMDADIIQLNEVEDCDALTLLVKAIAKLGDNTYAPYLIRGADSFTSQNAAIITRVDPIQDITRSTERVSYPVPSSTCGMFGSGAVERQNKGVSKNIIARFNVAGFPDPITLIGVHFLSRPQDYNRCYQREAQASVIAAEVAAARAGGDQVVVLGDFNDFSSEVLDIQSSRPISNVMGIFRDAGLENVGAKVPQEQRYTNWWDRNGDCVYRVPEEVSTLDHIMMSGCIADQVSEVVYGTEMFQMGCSSPYSDHFPVIATLKATGGACGASEDDVVMTNYTTISY